MQLRDLLMPRNVDHKQPTTINAELFLCIHWDSCQKIAPFGPCLRQYVITTKYKYKSKYKYKDKYQYENKQVQVQVEVQEQTSTSKYKYKNKYKDKY